jgi:hypothetical protein
VKLHYLEQGKGRPLVLLHGNGSMIEDWIVSGLFDRLSETHRVIAFDRPGFGHSERPRSRIWTPVAQAALLAEALQQLKSKMPDRRPQLRARWSPSQWRSIILSWSRNWPARRLFLPVGARRRHLRLAARIPVIGDVMRYTVSPLLGSALTPKGHLKRGKVGEDWGGWWGEGSLLFVSPLFYLARFQMARLRIFLGKLFETVLALDCVVCGSRLVTLLTYFFSSGGGLFVCLKI